MVFLPSKKKRAELAIQAVEKAIKNENQELICWRDVPIDESVLGKTAVSYTHLTLPTICSV